VAQLRDNGTRLLEAADSWKDEAQRNQRLVAALEAEREELLGLLFRASEWLVPDEHSPENVDKLACEINAAIDAARAKEK
jgi:hypothetical protein